MRRLELCLGVLGLGLLFLVLRWNSYDVPLVRDEGEYTYSAQLLTHGWVPYEQAFLQKPPMVIYSYALAQWVAPRSFWFPRIVAYLFVAAATALLGLIVRLQFGSNTAWAAVWLFTPLVLLPRIEQFTANTEMFMLLPLLGVVAASIISARTKAVRTAWVVAGFLAAVTFWYKYTALPILALVLVCWSVNQWRANRDLRALGLQLFCGLIGIVTASAAILAYFLAHDGGQHLWECTVQFNRHYAASATFGMSGLEQHLGFFWHEWWILFLLPAALLLRIERRLLYWVGLFIAAWIATGASVHGHYYIILMPFWAVLAALGLQRLCGWLASGLGWPKPWLCRLATAAVVAFICLPDLPWITRKPQQFAADRLQRVSPFLESVPVARRVAELTSPKDRIFVAGSEPQILCYAHRLSVTRFVIAYPLMIPSPVAKQYQQEVIRDLQAQPPAVIVFAMSNSSWLAQANSPSDLPVYLRTLLAEKYLRVGGYVIDGQEGHWAEPLPESQVPAASLILFKRKHS